MSTLSAQQIVERAIDLNLLSDRQVQELWGSLGTRNVSGAELTQALLRRELLTSYQLARLERGDRSGYFYGGFKVLYLVGAGTFARVYRAVAQQSGQIVALKVLRRRYCDNAEKRDQFLREGEMGTTLRHPNIVPIFEVGAQNASLYLVMEFIEGRDLREFVKIRKRCSVAEAVRLMIDVARGLDYALQRGIAHRDIKMSNVLISSRGDARLVDFGLASANALTDDAIEQCANARTIDYAGLERASSVRRDDPRSDLYFVGAMLYHMVAGSPPLPETRNKTQRLSKTRFLQVLPVEKVSAELPRPLVAVINRSIQLEADVRYQTPRELLADLEAVYGKLSEVDTVLEDEGVPAGSGAGSDLKVETPASASPAARRPIMFVESNVTMQDVFRLRLKRNGFRVLVTRDPQRAMANFEQGELPASCVVFSAGDLGEQALAAFNKFTRAPKTCHIPAVLLLAEEQADWASRVGGDQKHHVVLTMPITLRKLREVLDRLVPVTMP